MKPKIRKMDRDCRDKKSPESPNVCADVSSALGQRSKAEFVSSTSNVYHLNFKDAAISIPVMIWILANAIGILSFRGLPKNKREVTHLMLWFDTIFRRNGPLLPLIPWLFRAFSISSYNHEAADSLGSSKQRFDSLAHAHGRSRPSSSKSSDSANGVTTNNWLTYCFVDIWAGLAMYVVLALVRVGLYLLHLEFQGWYLLEPHASLMSDHVFLGCSVVATLQVEIILSAQRAPRLLSEWSMSFSAITKGGPLIKALSGACSLITACVLYMLLCFDMYYTCRFFHLPRESLVALASGFLVFQLPVLFCLHSYMI
ncbi:hypothetical protein CEUSTIGMA_g11369.t1 [Chlamydomonas eustigma]|uniref:Uncharacterized protein n=1 Tax=Chlamydomonas eustigma TaxID=1157962 RepID=A0A250XLG0_9CHLO|nr:hypothetical protein CEUSTIGMA_g11369.t1 [Chlamydomonas eustigma]|eukprot:GAX83945.1 hypothetical protein CEUSTIGMA_g11369.t1 [Chlamydomonas eustigma]